MKEHREGRQAEIGGIDVAPASPGVGRGTSRKRPSSPKQGEGKSFIPISNQTRSDSKSLFLII